MTTTSFRGLLVATAVAALLAASGAHAQTSAKAPPPPLKLTNAVAKSLNDANKATQTEDWNAAKTAIAAAAAVPNLTDNDKYMIAEFNRLVSSRTQDIPALTAASVVMADSPVAPDADKMQNFKIALQLELQAKQYDKALGYAKSLQALNPTDVNSLELIAKAFYFVKDFAAAEAAAQKGIDSTIAAGKKPPQTTYEVLMLSQFEGKNLGGFEKTLETMVANFNDPENWGQLIDVSYGTPNQSEFDQVWLGRLLFVTGATSPNIAIDASILGQAANKLTFYGDAQAAMQIGGTGFPDPKANADKDKKAMPGNIAAGQKAPSQYNAKLAEALYGYGMYPEAEAAARLAISKGGAADPSEAPMVLGQTLAAEGKYDDALAAFAQVKGGSPATPRIVRLWIDYVNVKKNPPAAAPAAAAK